MSQPILTLYLPGRTLYVVEYLNSTGQFWNTGTPGWEVYNQSNWANYVITLSEYSGSGIYHATFPSGIAAGSLTTEFLYAQNGGSPKIPGGAGGGDSFLTIMQSQGDNLQAIAGNGQAPINMSAAANIIIANGVVGTGTITSSSFPTNLTATQMQAYVGRIIAFASGVCAAQETNITGYIPTNGVLTVTPLTTAPAPGDVFVVL